jgi:hypothetical protein
MYEGKNENIVDRKFRVYRIAHYTPVREEQ